jgi:hypothetical protein
MTRIIGITIVNLAGVIALPVAPETARRAQIDKHTAAPVQRGDDKGAKGDAKDGKKLPAASSGESAAEIVKRLNRTFEEAESRLSDQDAREGTQKIQGQIIRDLDELINQNNVRSSSGSGASASPTSKRNSGKSGDPRQTNDRSQEFAGTKRDRDDNAAKNNAKGKEGERGDGDGAKKKVKAGDELKRISIADLPRDPWGELPPRKRQEMEVYGKERFLRKYEELLRQYYRTISENDRRND